MYTPEYYHVPHQLWLFTGYEYYPEHYPTFPMLFIWNYWNKPHAEEVQSS